MSATPWQRARRGRPPWLRDGRQHLSLSLPTRAFQRYRETKDDRRFADEDEPMLARG
jgi:hypothetical protein